ncbi:hypothetical protein PTSG_05392 [Salpingoeca rosetta]|uniref:Transmembrane protein n=1 Tax=Salpingoeca rosetta (strain ATCC 50818 / BSB-021) TaxID=946362 RepID=F2UAA9_SALR5|nr:uncharacterized protein PTSG_05392 [Salpingoeca rosetta]EGD73684.1 hypothetical protein PTSG_05392 [Salpingoeca rosetta]|eukprot:XP_004993965.1 hypothetical protein PTSG_05392 [Salpingoeca rosetta]
MMSHSSSSKASTSDTYGNVSLLGAFQRLRKNTFVNPHWAVRASHLGWQGVLDAERDVHSTQSLIGALIATMAFVGITTPADPILENPGFWAAQGAVMCFGISFITSIGAAFASANMFYALKFVPPCKKAVEYYLRTNKQLAFLLPNVMLILSIGALLVGIPLSMHASGMPFRTVTLPVLIFGAVVAVTVAFGVTFSVMCADATCELYNEDQRKQQQKQQNAVEDAPRSHSPKQQEETATVTTSLTGFGELVVEDSLAS